VWKSRPIEGRERERGEREGKEDIEIVWTAVPRDDRWEL